MRVWRHLSGCIIDMSKSRPEYKTTAFFHMYFQEKKFVLYSGQYGIYIYMCMCVYLYTYIINIHSTRTYIM